MKESEINIFMDTELFVIVRNALFSMALIIFLIQPMKEKNSTFEGQQEKNKCQNIL